MISDGSREAVRRAGDGGVPLEKLLPRRKIVAVIGIDDYACLPKLRCAVSDARGVLQLFTGLGFEAPIAPLLDREATKPAIESLVEDRLRDILQPDDALILFFAGHGTTRVAQLDGMTVETGYLCPVEARSAERFAELVNMEDLLEKVALLPPRHILVVLDACHSGMALGKAVVQYRSAAALVRTLLGNRSRRVITSARRDEPALDSGPIPGHSLFTGALIQALASGAADLDRNGFITFSELAVHLQQGVAQASGSRQTPDYGAFHLDDRGEMVLTAKEGALSEAVLPFPSDGAPERKADAAATPFWKRRGVLAGAAVLGVALVAGGGLAARRLLAGRAPFAPGSLAAGEYQCEVSSYSMDDCRVVVDSGGALRLRFDAPAIDASLSYDGPLVPREGRYSVPLDVRFRSEPTIDERARGGEIVLAPSPRGDWRGDWTYSDGSVRPFVLRLALPSPEPTSSGHMGTASPSGKTDPSPTASAKPTSTSAPITFARQTIALRSIDALKTDVRRAFEISAKSDPARQLLSADDYLGRSTERAAAGAVCRSYASLATLIGQTLAASGYKRDDDAGGKDFDEPACSTYVHECSTKDCCGRFQCGGSHAGAGGTVKEVLRVCAHIKLTAARCDVTLLPYAAVWWLGAVDPSRRAPPALPKNEISEGRGALIDDVTKGLDAVRTEMGKDP